MTTATTQSPKTPQIITPSARSSSRAEIDAAVAVLQENKGAWTAVPVRERIALLDELIQRFLAVADRWAALGIEAEGLDPVQPGSGEEALVGPYFMLRNLRLLREALLGRRDPRPAAHPRLGAHAGPDGQVAARVFPFDLWDRIFYAGVTADVWMEPGVTAESLPVHPGGGLPPGRAAGRRRARPRRRQRLLDRPHGRPLQAVRGGPGGPLQDPSAQRLPGSAHGRGAAAR